MDDLHLNPVNISSFSIFVFLKLVLILNLECYIKKIVVVVVYGRVRG